MCAVRGGGHRGRLDQGPGVRPSAITAKVGDVIAFTNDDSASHTATLDQGDCGTDTLSNGATEGLTFSVAGTYPFHCAIHSSMTGTITVTD